MWMLLLTTTAAFAGDDTITYTPWKGAELKAGTEDSAFTAEWNHTWELEDKESNGRLDLSLSGSQDDNIAELFRGPTPASGVSLEVFLGWDHIEGTLGDRLESALERHSAMQWLEKYVGPDAADHGSASTSGVDLEPRHVLAWIEARTYYDEASILRQTFDEQCEDVVPDDYAAIDNLRVAALDGQLTATAHAAAQASATHTTAVAAAKAADEAVAEAEAALDYVAGLAAQAPPPDGIAERVAVARAARSAARAEAARAKLAVSEALEKKAATAAAEAEARRVRQADTCGHVKAVLTGELATDAWQDSALRTYQRTGITPSSLPRGTKTSFGVELEAEYSSVKAFTRSAGVISDDTTTFADFELAAGPRLEQTGRSFGVQLSALAGAAQGVSTQSAELCTALDATLADAGAGELDRTGETCSDVKLLEVDGNGDSTAPSVSGTAEAQARIRWLLRPASPSKDVDAVPGIELKVKVDDLLEDDPAAAFTLGLFLVRTEGKAPVRTGVFVEQALGFSGEVAPVRGYAVIGASL